MIELAVGAIAGAVETHRSETFACLKQRCVEPKCSDYLFMTLQAETMRCTFDFDLLFFVIFMLAMWELWLFVGCSEGAERDGEHVGERARERERERGRGREAGRERYSPPPTHTHPPTHTPHTPPHPPHPTTPHHTHATTRSASDGLSHDPSRKTC